MDKFLVGLLAWGAMMLVIVVLSTLFYNFVVWHWWWPWQWGVPGRAVLAVSGGLLAVAVLYAEADD